MSLSQTKSQITLIRLGNVVGSTDIVLRHTFGRIETRLHQTATATEKKFGITEKTFAINELSEI